MTVINSNLQSFGKRIEPITDTASHAGPYIGVVPGSNGCAITTTGLTNNLSDFPLSAPLSFGREQAATIQLSSGECIALVA